jgi:uracil phosphoribosyltransferase
MKQKFSQKRLQRNIIIMSTTSTTTSAVDPSVLHPNLVLSQSRAYPRLISKLRNVSTTSEEFMCCANRVLRLLAEDALAEFPTRNVVIQTPCGSFQGVQSALLEKIDDGEGICAVSIMRSGDAVLEAVRSIEPGVSVGKILIQRDEGHPDKVAKLLYVKLPPNILKDYVLLCDPMLATGGSAHAALDVLVRDHSIAPERIIFATLICAPDGLKRLAQYYPQVKVVTICIDPSLNSEKFIVPGLGDFGDRFYNTTA